MSLWMKILCMCAWGYDVISNVIDDFLTKSWADPKIAHFFVGMGTDTRNQLRQKNKNLMCYTTGGPCRVINRPLEVVHVGWALRTRISTSLSIISWCR